MTVDELFKEKQNIPHILVPSEDYFEYRKLGYVSIFDYEPAFGNKYYYMMAKEKKESINEE